MEIWKIISFSSKFPQPTFKMIGHQIVFILLYTSISFPMTGSRSVGTRSGIISEPVSSIEVSDNTKNTDESRFTTNGESEESDQSVFSSDNNVTVVKTNPCALVTMSLLDGRDGKFMPYEDKILISVAHQIFDVSQGIVPTIIYEGEYKNLHILFRIIVS